MCMYTVCNKECFTFQEVYKNHPQSLIISNIDDIPFSYNTTISCQRSVFHHFYPHNNLES